MSFSSSKDEPQANLRTPSWLYVIGVFEAVVFAWIFITTAIFLAGGADLLWLSQDPREDDRAKSGAEIIKYIFIFLAVIFLINVLFCAILTFLVLTALISSNGRTKRQCLRLWMYGSYTLIALDGLTVIGKIVSIIKQDVLADEKIDKTTMINYFVHMNEPSGSKPTDQMCIAVIAVAISDMVIRGVAIYGVGKFVSKLSAKIRYERTGLGMNQSA